MGKWWFSRELSAEEALFARMARLEQEYVDGRIPHLSRLIDQVSRDCAKLNGKIEALQAIVKVLHEQKVDKKSVKPRKRVKRGAT